MSAASPESTMPMTLIAGAGLVTAKLVTLVAVLTQPDHAHGLAAVLTSFGPDAVVILWVAALEYVLRRVGRARAPVLLRAAPFLGLAVGLYAAWSLPTMGSRLLAALVFLLAAPLVIRLDDALGAAARGMVIGGIALYSVTALAYVQSTPSVASRGDIHQSAVAEVAIDALITRRPTTVEKLPDDGDDLGTPPGNSWERRIMYTPLLRPKHVVLWVTPSVNPRATSLYSTRAESTPTLERLRDNTLKYTRYYANVPTPAKALFSMLCGMYPYPARAAMPEMNPRIACPSLVETLGGMGYRSGLFSSGPLGVDDVEKIFFERGLSALIDGDTMPERHRYWKHPGGLDDAAMVREALHWLDARPDPDQPTLSILVSSMPTSPFDTPPRPFDVIPTTPSRRVKHLRSVEYNDAQFGRLHKGYVERGLSTDTLFVYVGAHGQPMGQRHNNRHPSQAVYEENVSVPLAFIAESLFQKETTSHRLGSHVDLLPTILGLLGKDIPEGLQGQSLIANDFGYRPIHLGAYGRETSTGALRHGHFKYIHHFHSGEEEVYDLSVDPNERTNLAAQLDPYRLSVWRRAVVEHHARQRPLLTEHASHGPPYLHRAFTSMDLTLVDNKGRTHPCDEPGPPDKWRMCPGQPDEEGTYIAQQLVRGTLRECIVVHPPESGTLSLRFPNISPPPRMIGGGIDDWQRRIGGTPVHLTWTIGDQEPIEQILTDDDESGYGVQVLTHPPDRQSVDVTVTVHTDDRSDRRTCLVLAP